MRLPEAVIAVLLLAGNALAAPSVVLSWEPMPGATGYEVEVAADAELTARVVAESSAAPRYEWKMLPDRTYYWRVRCRFSHGRIGEWSAVRTIPRAVHPVALSSPADGETITCPDEGCRVRLAFVRSPALAEYRVEITREADTDFLVPDLDVRVTSEDHVEWSPDDTGAFRWRVSATDLMGRPVAPSESLLIVQRPAMLVAESRPLAATVVAGPVMSDLEVLLDTPLPQSHSPSRASLGNHDALPVDVILGFGWRETVDGTGATTPVMGLTRRLRGDFAAGAQLSSTSARGVNTAEIAFWGAVTRPVTERASIAFRAGPVLQVAGASTTSGAMGGGVELSTRIGGATWLLSADVRSGHRAGGALLMGGVRFR